MSCLGGIWGGFGVLWKIFLRVTPVLRPGEPLHPPHPFVTSRVVWSICVTYYVSTCCNIDTLVFVSLWVSKFRFLGVIFGGAVLCIYYANEFSILPPFCSFLPCLILSYFTAFLFFFYSFLALFFYCWFVLFILICFVSIHPNLIRYFVRWVKYWHVS